ncbi:TGB2 [Garlic virus J]|nr:TGB2 [Garlic virus J]
MSFTPPPDYTRIYTTLAAGAALGAIIYTLRSNHLPTVGDNTHSLPHGGRYCDGNKQILYNGPNTGSAHSTTFWPFATICALTFIIHCLSCRRSRVCVRCTESH